MIALFLLLNVAFATVKKELTCTDEFKGKKYVYGEAKYGYSVIEFNQCVATDEISYKYQGCSSDKYLLLKLKWETE